MALGPTNCTTVTYSQCEHVSRISNHTNVGSYHMLKSYKVDKYRSGRHKKITTLPYINFLDKESIAEKTCDELKTNS